MNFSDSYIKKLNRDIEYYTDKYPEKMIFPITSDMKNMFEGVSQTVMLDRYANNDLLHETLSEGDFVILTVKEDPKWPTRGFGWIQAIHDDHTVTVKVEEDFAGALEGEEAETLLVRRDLDIIQKPFEIFHEQIAKRNAWGLAAPEKTPELREEWANKFYEEMKALNFVPAGRVLYGAGAGTDVTYFNCYVMPYIPDSREGISDHRKKVMEIMSRGGGVGSNGSTLRPRNEVARGVNGKSSGSVSWMNDIANLTNLVEQGGSRRGAQMIMLIDNHPDIIEFIISKMQNPAILKFIIENSKDEHIRSVAKSKLKFVPLTANEKQTNEMIVIYSLVLEGIKGKDGLTKEELAAKKEALKKLEEGGTWAVHNPDFLTGANISVCLTHEFMEAVENDEEYTLRFPDVANYSKEEMAQYNEKWHEVGDVREWEAMGFAIRTYRSIRAKELWQLINICSTYSAEPGIFFIDNANDKTNAKAYGQKVVATNPCGEQPLAPYSVCNLAAVNLSQMASFETGEVDFEKLRQTVRVGVRMQDNVIDATPYFLEENTTQALGERRVGLGVMGLHDLLIKCGVEYGSEEGNVLVDKVFEVISHEAYKTSIELAREKGSFPFLDGNHEAFIETGYMKGMPEDIREGVLLHGIRNSHLLTVAPTGSTGTMVGGSTGLEPYFSLSYFRSGRLGKFIEVKAPIVQEYLKAKGLSEDTPLSELPSYFKGAMDLTPEQHADVQCIIQRHVDSSLSKTVNAPKGYTVEQVQGVYERLWKGGAKGGTVYVDGSRDAQVLTLTAEENTIEELVEVESKVVAAAVEAAPEITYGSEVGNTCPICKAGTMEDLGGCTTCSNCGSQLKCGL